MDLADAHTADIEKLMRGVKGFVSYMPMRTGDGGLTITVCQDKAGADESSRKAKEWVQKNAPKTGAVTPVVSEGPVVLHVK
jgi:hypothetical protein